jgi:transposase
MPKVSPYSEEFKREAVLLLRSSGRPIPRLAKELGVSPQSLRNWAAQRDIDDGKAAGLTSDEREELRRLRREVKVLAEEREILKKPRPSSRWTATGPAGDVRVRRFEEGRALDRDDVPRARRQPLGLSRLGDQAVVGACCRGRAADRPHPGDPR